MTGPVTVGVDGSAASRAALEWAVAEAGRTGSSVAAVSVWRLPAGYEVESPANIEIVRYVRERLDATVLDVAEGCGVEVTADVIRGRAETVLVELSKGSSLLVVGCQGLGNGDRAERLLGEVSSYVVGRAHCPVVVVNAGSVPAAPASVTGPNGWVRRG